MKKLNRKGFTLVELLAVIIILAIVVGITIPAVLTTTSSAKDKAFQTAAETTADWIDRQYQVVSTGLNGTGIAAADPAFVTACGQTGSDCHCTFASGSGANTNKCGTTYKKAVTTADFIAAAGLKTTNVTKVEININSKTGRSCVKLTGDGDYSGTKTAGAC